MATSTRTKRRSGGDGMVSKEVLVKMAAIRESSRKATAELSSSDEESSDESDELVSSALSKYYQLLGASNDSTVGIQFVSSSTSCLVCLSVIKRSEAVWSCQQCWCIFHLVCIQQWARDGVKVQHPVLSAQLFPSLHDNWSCPKCRQDYGVCSIPQIYSCFCGKQVDPVNDPWLLAHSCGELCNKLLSSQCGHQCVSLCHPGPCPPCPRTVLTSCFCGRSQPVMKRCGVNGWRCKHVCGRVLSCDLHTCEERCHEGNCKPCNERILQRCKCGRQRKERSCDNPIWLCEQVCGQMLPCGEHVCEQVCHSGECGDCPRSGVRQCPCGKTSCVLPCTEDVPTCNDTCDKLLECGSHRCSRLCHSGGCGRCLQMSVKVCRCGKKTKSVLCSQEFLCETKCTTMRQCGRHQCKRKCCSGECPSCEQVCGRTLGCRNHKCQAPCHQGKCYPCVLGVDKACRCGATVITVLCGRERYTKPPRCKKRCTAPSVCHHTHRQPHHCHFGECPPCSLVCGKVLACGHNCVVRCHSVPKPIKQVPRIAWSKSTSAEQQQTDTSCPPCQVLISKSCKGGHEVTQVKCSEYKDYSCGRKCGRNQQCGNHSCERGCHVVVNPPSKSEAGEDCLPCERECTKPREKGCGHSCPLPCHQGKCPCCDQLVKLRCHCNTMSLFVKCHEWCAADNTKKTHLQTCNSQCTKLLECGHRCPLHCHSGPCISEHECKRRVTLRCPCKRRKKECRCCERSEVSCDRECDRLLKERKLKQQEEQQALESAKEREKKETEMSFERQLHSRRRRRRAHQNDEPTNVPSSLSAVTYWTKRALPVLIVLTLIIVLVYVIMNVRIKIRVD